MKLTRIQLAQFRKFRDAIDIRDLDAGLNLFTGPNEAGKSTIAAAIRAAFFERHRSKVVEDFRPFADPQAAPAITLEFTVAGTDYRLFKQFLTRARCTLEFGARRLDGEQAEDYLAKLLGYQYASRGRSKADDWGIPGLLWVEQGRSQDLDAAIAHAVAHLRTALGVDPDSRDGENAEDASQIAGIVARERNDLLTLGGGAPRGAYAEALKRVQQLEAEHHAIVQETAHYRQAVDRLAELSAAHQADQTEQPWQAIRQQQHAAQAQLDAAQQWQQRLQDCLRQQEQLQETAALFQDQLRHLAQQTETLGQRRAALQTAHAAWQQANTEAGYREQEYDKANAALTRAQHTLEQCRARDQRDHLQQQRASLVQQLDDAQRRLAQADAAHQALQDLQTQLAGLHVDDQDLTALRKLSRQRNELHVRQQAHATRLQFALEAGAALTIDGEPLHGSGERRLTDVATLHLPGVGTLRIQPGGEDLQTLRQTRASLDADWTALLQRLRAASLEDAETRHLQAAVLRADCARHEQTLHLHAPQGTDALRRAIAALQARQGELDAQQPPAADAVAQDMPADIPAKDASAKDVPTKDLFPEDAPAPPVSTAQAQADVHTAQATANAARARRQQAQLALGAAQTRHEHAQAELHAAQAAVDDATQQQRMQDYQRRLVDANAQLAQQQTQAQTLQENLKQIRADILAQDVARYQRSADQLQQAHQQRHETLLRLDAELQTLGARGLDEREAALALELAQAQRRAAELARRARALDHLLRLLRDRQHNATQALQQPLQRHLRHYLNLLFPGAQLGLTQHLTPDTLQRSDVRDGQRLELLQMLSHGAREQLGIIGRLACADLLRQAGRPTLLMLDDALVHTDAARLAQLKRILFDAATRHQVLLFSCHDAWWRDMGILPRDVGMLGA